MLRTEWFTLVSATTEVDMGTVQRHEVHFSSGGARCAAWHYPGSRNGCVVMAAGTAIPKEPGTDRFARRFVEAGFTVLAFDFRHLGASGGLPRDVVRVREQLADWDAALAHAATLPGVDPERIAAWGFSLAGGQVFDVAARSPSLAAAIAQSPLADGRAVVRNALRHQTPSALLRLTGLGVLDALGALVGRDPLLVPLAGERGTVAVLTTPDGQDGDRALDPDGAYADWARVLAARSALGLGSYRPGRSAPRVRCPVLVLACEQDETVLAGPAVQAAGRAPRGELVRLPGGHYAPFLDAHEQAVEAEVSFLRRHLLESPAALAVPGAPTGRPLRG
jgi:pimeloyl-ACP methyl ester carboxylesterase